MILFGTGLLLGVVAAAAFGFWRFRRYQLLIGNFLAFALHELNTPLTAINMTVLNFLSGVFGDVSKDQLKWMELMRTQIARLSGVSGELRDIVHCEFKKDLMLIPERVLLPEAVERAVDQIKKGVSNEELRLEVSLAERLPAVRADADRLSRTILSLIFHARKFKSSGPITITSEVLGPRVALSVGYAGLPIEPGEVGRSLELYYPGRHSKDEKLCAVGMGLGALRIFMRRQGGELEFHSDSRGLSKAILILPIFEG